MDFDMDTFWAAFHKPNDLVEWKGNDGYLKGFHLYTVCTDGKKWYAQGATLKAMSIICKSEVEAKTIISDNAAKVLKAFKGE